jgi:DtxR family Mn-dependent transcriptional regulator
MPANPVLTLFVGTILFLLLGLLFWPDSGLYARWLRARRTSARIMREDALKRVYARELAGQPLGLAALAGELGISVDAAAQLMAEMLDLQLIEMQEEYFELSGRGRELAVHMLRAHRLLEKFLHDHTGYREEEWHARAEEQEHFLGPDEVAALDARLGHPRFDPHGDPIPTPAGEVVLPKSLPLSHLEPGDIARIEHLDDQPEVIYAQLVAEGLPRGMEVLVLEKDAQRIRFLAHGKEHVLAPVLAANLFLLPCPQTAATEAMQAPGVPLSSLTPGHEAEVTQLSRTMRPAVRHRLMDLGVLPGVKVRAEFVSPVGEPVAYMIRGALIALRKEQSSQIFVQPLNAQPGNSSPAP